MPKKATAARQRKARPAPEIGEYVLLGASHASYPATWQIGWVLWVGEGDVLVRRNTLNGKSWREVRPIEEVRAHGTIAELAAVQEIARAGVAELVAAIDLRAHELGAARDRLFAKLAELAQDGLAVIPPDFPAIDAAQQRTRDAFQQEEEERLAKAAAC